MSTRDVNHGRDSHPGIREGNIVPQLEQTQDRLFLFGRAQLREGTGQVPTCSQDGGTAGSEIPVARCMKVRPAPTKTDEKLLDQEPVVEDDGSRRSGQGA